MTDKRVPPARAAVFDPDHYPEDARILQLQRERDAFKAALRLVLDQVDYTNGACGATEMVGACLPTKVIDIARALLAASEDAP